MPGKKQPARQQQSKAARRRARRARAQGVGLTPDQNAMMRKGYAQAVQNIVRAPPVKRSFQLHPTGVALTKQMMMPFEQDYVRLPTTDMPRCAITRNRLPQTFTETVGVTSNTFQGNTYVAIVYGQPALQYIDGPHYVTSNYQTRFIGNTGTWNVNLNGGSSGPATGGFVDVNEPWPLIGHTWQSLALRGSGDQPTITVNGRSYLFLNQGETLVLGGTVSGSAPVGSVYFELFALGDPTEPPTLLTPLVNSVAWVGTSIGATNVYTAPSPQWVNFSVQAYTLTSGTLLGMTMNFTTATGASNLPIWYFWCNSEVLSDATVYTECRRTAQTLLVTNTSSSLNAQGDVISARVLPFTIGFLPSTFLVAAEKYTGKAKNGAYTYMEFTLEDEPFRPAANKDGYPIAYYPYAMANVISVTNASVATAPNTYIITADALVEFKTSSQRYPQDVSSAEFLGLIEARRINNSTPYFYENTIHWRDILAKINQAWGLLRGNAIRLGMAGSVLFPEAAPAIMPAARFLQT